MTEPNQATHNELLQEIQAQRIENQQTVLQLQKLQERVGALETTLIDHVSESVRSPLEKELKQSRGDRRILLGLIALLTLVVASTRFSVSNKDGSIAWSLESQGNDQLIARIIEISVSAGALGLGGAAVWNARSGSKNLGKDE